MKDIMKIKLGVKTVPARELNKDAGYHKFMTTKYPQMVITDRALMRSVNFKLQNQFNPGHSNVGAIMANTENVIIEDEEKRQFEIWIKELTTIPDFSQNIFLLKDMIDGVIDLGENYEVRDKEYWDSQIEQTNISFDELMGKDKSIEGQVIMLTRVEIGMENFLAECRKLIEDTGRYIVMTKDDLGEATKAAAMHEVKEVIRDVEVDFETDKMQFIQFARSQGFLI